MNVQAVEASQAKPLPARRLFPTLQLSLLLALGAAGFGASTFLPDLFWVSLLYNLGLGAAVALDIRKVRGGDQVSTKRELDLPLSLGASNPVTLTLNNKSHFPLYLQIRDEMPHPFEFDHKLIQTDLAPGTTDAAHYHITPLERGLYQFGALNIRFSTNWKLVTLQRRYALEEEVKVYPNITDTKKHKLLAKRQQLSQMGLHTMKFKGGGMAFESLRNYVPGDELRHMDWKASARRGRLITRQYQLERGQNLMVLLDVGRTMASRGEDLSKLDHAVNAAMLLSYVAVQQEDRVGMMAFADEVMSYLPLGKGEAQQQKVMDMLYALQPQQVESDYRRVFLEGAIRLRKRSLIVLLTDLIDPDSSARLIAHILPLVRKHLVLCVALSDYEWLDLIDRVPQDAREVYQQSVAISMIEDRKMALAKLSSYGVLTLDATPKDLSVAVVNRYLKLKRDLQL